MNNFFDKFRKYNLPILELGVKLPQFDIEDKHINRLNLSKDITDYDFLRSLCYEGLNKKVGNDNPRYDEYLNRTKEELSVFKELGFCSYLLITWDIVNYCIENKIPTGFGRGSAAGSLVLYLIGCTQIDSLLHGLYFQRFLSKARAKMKEVDGVKYYQGDLLMDIDLDISFSHRQQLTNWLAEKYNGKIAKQLTVSTYSSKVLIKEVVKGYLEYNEEEAKEISEMIPKIYGNVKSIEESYDLSPEFKKFSDKNKEAIEIGKNLYELYSHFGVHASAWIITSDLIGEIFPLQLTKEKELVTSYTMEDSSNLAIKCDILGLRCATLISQVCNLINVKANEIDLSSNIIYDNLQDLKTPHGLFQIEADCNLRVAKQLRPKNLNHLAAVISCARPGGLEFVEDFANFIKDGSFKSIHPFFDDILKESAGVPIYQEHQLKMLNKIGFTLDESEVCRRVLGKKKIKEVEEWKNKIRNKVKENNLSEEIGEIVAKVIADSASYSFNFSHAISYASMCAATVYLKFKYPKEFFLCLLNLTKDESNPTEEVTKIQEEMNYFGVKLLPPHILKSQDKFIIEGDNIRYPLNSIKGISEKTLAKLRNFCHPYSNKFEIMAAAQECKLSIAVTSSIIACGAMDDFLTNNSRANTILELSLFNQLTPGEKKRIMQKNENNESILGKQFNYNLLAIIRHLSPKSDKSPDGIGVIKESRLKTLRRDFAPYKKIFDVNSQNEELCNFILEKSLLGFSYSQNIFNILQKSYPHLTKISEINGAIEGEMFTFGGEVSNYKQGKSKNGNKYIKINVNDGSGNIDVLLMENGHYKGKKVNQFEMNDELNKGIKLEEGIIVAVEGKKGKDNVVFASKIVNQNVKILSKTSELKEK